MLIKHFCLTHITVCHRSSVLCTANYIVCRDADSETASNIYCRHSGRLVGVLERPFDGEWGWDYETDVMEQHDVLIARACLPPHVLRFYHLADVDGVCPPPYKELTVEAEQFWV